LVPSEKRSKVRAYVERMMGAGVLGQTDTAPASPDGGEGLALPDPVVSAPPAATGGSQGPALMLGDPSNVRLRDPDQTLKLDLDE
jgi:hypothetical protein